MSLLREVQSGKAQPGFGRRSSGHGRDVQDLMALTREALSQMVSVSGADAEEVQKRALVALLIEQMSSATPTTQMVEAKESKESKDHVQTPLCSGRSKTATPKTSISFWKKFVGVENYMAPSRPSTSFVLGTGLISFLGIGLLSLVHFGLTDQSEYTMLLGSFGANAVLMFAMPAAPVSQPRNVLGGHLIGAVVGVAAQKTITAPMGSPCVGAAASCSVAIMLMALTGTTHPPGGGTAIIAAMAMDGSVIASLGWRLIVTAMMGALMLVSGAALLNNLVSDRQYPQTWH